MSDLLKTTPSTLASLVDQKKQEDDKEKAAAYSEFEQAVEVIKVPQVGDNILGKVLEVSKNTVFLDLGPYGLGVIRGRELWEALDSYTNLKKGEEVSATVMELENENGNIELSFKQASREQAWTDLNAKLENKEIFEVKIKDVNRGGLLTMINGIAGFLPVSQLASEHYPRVEGGDQMKILEKLREFIGQKIRVQVITADKKEEKLIISEKRAEFEKQKEKMGDLKVGEIIEGEISGVVDFGAFVKFNGFEGLIHISELAWQRIDSPRDIVKVGQKVKAKIIGVDDTKITLSLKRLHEDPWQKNAAKYKVGDKIKGKVIKLTPYGAFVQLDQDIHGLVHISEISAKKVNDLKEFLKIGDEREFKILSLEPKEHRLGLSLKAVTEPPKEDKAAPAEAEAGAETKKTKEAVKEEKAAEKAKKTPEAVKKE